MSRAGSRWIATLVAIAVLLSLALWLRQIDLKAPPRFLPRCLFHAATGWHCPGCGNTRAAQAVLRGDVAEALRQNVFTIAFLPFLAFLAWRSWMAWIYPGKLRPLPFRWQQAYTHALIGGMMLFWVLRNLPWPPCTWLAPDPPGLMVNPASEATAMPSRDARPREER